MRGVLDILKRNLFNIICGVVVVASLAMGGWGISSMSAVTTEMTGVMSLHSQFGRFKRGAANDRTIEAEKSRVEAVRRNYGQFLEAALAFNDFKPLDPPAGEAFFPTPTQKGKLEFPQIYVSAFDGMLDLLKAGVPPTVADISQTQEEMEQEALAAESFGVDEEADASGGDGIAHVSASEEAHKSGLITEADARGSATARASIRRARSISCYADASLFDLNAKIAQQGPFSVPPPAEMWKAQVSLWVQQDVISSLARINDTASERLKSAGRSAWVGVLPIKDVISIRVSDYLPTEARGAKRDVMGPDPAGAIGSSEKVFTQNKSNELYDLVQFTLKMVVDPRELPFIIDEICGDRFHTLLNIEYAYETEALQSLDMSGKIYGSGPAVKVLMDFETIFFGDKYRRLMPDSVLAEIGQKRPENKKES